MTSSEFRSGRAQLGLTQAELGEIMGMSPSAVSRIEAGTRGASPTMQHAAFLRVLLNHVRREHPAPGQCDGL